MSNKTYWASRDFGPEGLPKHIKLWEKEPRQFDNGSWVGKVFLGSFDHDSFSISLENGECREVVLEIIDAAIYNAEPAPMGAAFMTFENVEGEDDVT